LVEKGIIVEDEECSVIVGVVLVETFNHGDDGVVEVFDIRFPHRDRFCAGYFGLWASINGGDIDYEEVSRAELVELEVD